MATVWEGTANPLVITPQSHFLKSYGWILREGVSSDVSQLSQQYNVRSQEEQVATVFLDLFSSLLLGPDTSWGW